MNNKPLSILTFPIWWYTEGSQMAWHHTQERFRYVLRSTGLLIFFRNLTQPLYGDTTRQGRIISIFIRIVLLFFIVLWTGVRLALSFGLFFVHIFALPVAIVMIIYQLFSLFGF